MTLQTSHFPGHTRTKTPAGRLSARLTALLCVGACLLAGIQSASAATPAPIPVTRADGEAHQPFQNEQVFFQGTGASFGTTSSFTVPAGKVLVIQSYSALGYAQGSSRVMLEIQTTAAGTTANHYAGVLTPAPSSGFFVLPLTSGTLHADAGSTVTVTLVRDVPPAANFGYYDDIIVSGYLVNVP